MSKRIGSPQVAIPIAIEFVPNARSLLPWGNHLARTAKDHADETFPRDSFGVVSSGSCLEANCYECRRWQNRSFLLC
jgi:hypothetical protein